MIRLKKIKLHNFCGYRDFEFSPQQWAVLYGPNGSFKSSFLEAVRMLSSPRNFIGREDNTLLFRRLTYHPDYQPGMEGFDRNKTEMLMEGFFETDDGEKKVVIKNNWVPEESGVIVNELQEYHSPCVHIDADKFNSLYKFQLRVDYKDVFLDMTKSVYGFECEIPDTREKTVAEYYDDDNNEEKNMEFYTNFIITKYNNTKVPFKRMSGGEKKLATLLRFLIKKCYNSSENVNDIILIDNIEKEVYYKRHMKLIYKLQEHFPKKQFIITTHSPIIINKMEKKYLVDMEEYIK